ncbi:MAG: hypothetical protein R3B07_18205 [Polyangiaceae bacterium]
MSPPTNRGIQVRMRRTALVGLLLGILTACSSAAVQPSAPIEVGAPQQPPGPEEPAAQAQPNPFPKFADEFTSALLNKQDLDRYIAPELGVFLLTNPGAFHVVTHFDSFAELRSEATPYLLERLGSECKDAAWFTSDDHVPTYSCDTEQYDIQAPCVRGTIRSAALSKLISLNVQYELIPADEGERRIPAAKRSEALATHYLFMQPYTLGFYFGQVDGSWKLLWIDSIEPCSA